MKRRYVLWGLAVAVALFAASEAGIFYYRKAISVHEQRTTGRLLLDRVMLSVHFQAMAGEDNDRDRGFLEVAKSLDEKLKGQQYSVRFISPDPRLKTEQPKDDFERGLLARFPSISVEERASAERPVFAERYSVHGTEYRYYQPVFAAKQCLNICHVPGIETSPSDPDPAPFGRAAPGNQKWNAGDVMAVVEVTFPLPVDER
jgi:hypothetical protein